MSTKTLTNKPSTLSVVRLIRDGADFYADIEIRFGIGAGPVIGAESVTLSKDEILTVITATALPNGTTQRQAQVILYDLLFNAALSKAGYV
jgi:hypothetical protein